MIYENLARYSVVFNMEIIGRAVLEYFVPSSHSAFSSLFSISFTCVHRDNGRLASTSLWLRSRSFKYVYSVLTLTTPRFHVEVK